jgi:hypothetical protein
MPIYQHNFNTSKKFNRTTKNESALAAVKWADKLRARFSSVYLADEGLTQNKVLLTYRLLVMVQRYSILQYATTMLPKWGLLLIYKASRML